MPKSNSVHLIDDRQNFSIVYHELWDCYLPQIGPAATLLYCYLLRLASHGLSGPGGAGWQAEVCAPLGMNLNDSHQAWARLQECGLILANSDGSYSLMQPKSREEFQAAFKDFQPLQQPLLPVNNQSSIQGEAAMRALRRNRGQKTLFSVVEQEFGRPLSMTEMEKVLSLEKAHPRELVELATEMAVIAQARSMAYIEQILLNWQLKGITTAQAARQDSEQHRMQKARRRSSKKAEAKPEKDSAYAWDDIRIYRALPPKEE
jgi:DnaD/phage-associated family protein